MDENKYQLANSRMRDFALQHNEATDSRTRMGIVRDCYNHVNALEGASLKEKSDLIHVFESRRDVQICV